MKRIRDLFRKRESRAVRTGPVVAPPRATNAPKNGPLVVMVAALLLIMIGLGILNVQLIRDPSVAGKAFNPSASSHMRDSCQAVPAATTARSNENSLHVPPVVTFYRQLTAQEEQVPQEESTPPEKMSEQDVPTPEKKDVPLPHAARAIAHQRKQLSEPDAVAPSQSDASVGLPIPPEGTKNYTVQVGAFTHPAVARQWAEKWKARGFKVSLKPVARPRTGVIYRLYLGKFDSEKKADELVYRLKSKEGISAFRLLVRN